MALTGQDVMNRRSAWETQEKRKAQIVYVSEATARVMEDDQFSACTNPYGAALGARWYIDPDLPADGVRFE